MHGEQVTTYGSYIVSFQLRVSCSKSVNHVSIHLNICDCLIETKPNSHFLRKTVNSSYLHGLKNKYYFGIADDFSLV